MKREIALALTGVLFTLALCAQPYAQARGEKLRVVYSAIGSSQSPLWIAHEAGIFKKHGLDVELLYVAGGSRAKSARAEQFIDGSLMQELEKEGFIKQLWR